VGWTGVADTVEGKGSDTTAWDEKSRADLDGRVTRLGENATEAKALCAEVDGRLHRRSRTSARRTP
jgi:hypothetical protein